MSANMVTCDGPGCAESRRVAAFSSSWLTVTRRQLLSDGRRDFHDATCLRRWVQDEEAAILAKSAKVSS